MPRLLVTVIGEYATLMEVRIGVHTVGICGSDVHCFTHGRIGPYVVENPMVLGHEASGTVLEVGEGVDHLAVGDRVCMEPRIPNPRSRASRLGMYNVDPDVQFWATPPVDGCLQPEIVHPADFTYKLPEQLSLGEGALIEPFAVAVHAVTKSGLAPGVVVVVGAGIISELTAIAPESRAVWRESDRGCHRTRTPVIVHVTCGPRTRDLFPHPRCTDSLDTGGVAQGSPVLVTRCRCGPGHSNLGGQHD